MRKKKNVALAFLTAISGISVASRVASAVDVPTLPEGYENFDPSSIDFQSFLGDAVVMPDNLTLACTVSSATGTTSFSSGNSLSLPPTGIAGIADALKIRGVLLDDNAILTSSCRVGISLPTALQETTIPVSNDALAPIVGTSEGTIALECSVNAAPTVTLRVRMGGGVPGIVDIVATGLSAPIPFQCSFKMAFFGEGFGESTLVGTVEGAITLMTSSELSGSTICDGTTTITCIPIDLTNANVNITIATGELEGLVGTGDFGFKDSFGLDAVENKLATLASAAGVDITAQRFRSSRLNPFVRTGPNSSMTLELGAGANRARILRPFSSSNGATATIRDGGFISVVSKAGSRCAVSAKKGVGSWVALGTVVAGADGVGTQQLRTTWLAKFKATGVAKNGVVTLKAACGTAGTAQKTVKYLG